MFCFLLLPDDCKAIPADCKIIEVGAGMNVEIFIQLCSFLQTNTTIETVIVYNQIGDEGVKAMVEALKVNCTITKLDLYGNHIGNEGAKALAEALKVNCTLKELNLYYNLIGNEGAKAIAEALKVNCTVTDLVLSDNPIGTNGIKAIAEATKINYIVTRLDLFNTSIGTEEERYAIEKDLGINCAITKAIDSKNMTAKCKKTALGLGLGVPIYLLLEILQLGLILEIEKEIHPLLESFELALVLEKEDKIHCSFKHLKKSRSEQHLVKRMNAITNLVCNKFDLQC